jgi:hypothetical protein
LAFENKMGEKHKSTSPSAIQVKNQWKTVSTEEKLDVISQLWKGEWIVDICQNVSFAHISVHTIRENDDRITASANSGTKVFM